MLLTYLLTYFHLPTYLPIVLAYLPNYLNLPTKLTNYLYCCKPTNLLPAYLPANIILPIYTCQPQAHRDGRGLEVAMAVGHHQLRGKHLPRATRVSLEVSQ